MDKIKNKNAFTLLELLVVVVVIGILAAIALPQYQKTVWRTRSAQLMSAIRAVAQGEELHYIINSAYTNDIGALDISFDFLPDHSRPDGNVNRTGRGNDDWDVYVFQKGEQCNIVSRMKKRPYAGSGFWYSLQTDKSHVQTKIFYCREQITPDEGQEGFCTNVMGSSSTPTSIAQIDDDTREYLYYYYGV